MTHATLALAALRRRPLRTLAAMLAFTVSVGPCLVAASAIARSKVMQQAFDRPYVIVRPFLQTEMPMSYANKLRQIPGVDGVEWQSYLFGNDGSHRTHYSIWATSGGYLDTVPYNIVHVVDPRAREAWNATRNGALVSERLAKRMRWSLGQAVELDTPRGQLKVSIVGWLDGLTNERAIVHYEMANRVAHLDDQVSSFSAHCPTTPPETLAPAIDATLSAGAVRTLSMSSRSFGAGLFADSPVLDFITKQAFLLLAIGVVVTGGAIAASIRERKTELASLRAIGFSKTRVTALIVAEAEIIALTGTAVAVLPLFVLFHSEGLTLGWGSLNNVTVSAAHCLLAIAAAALLGLCTALAPLLALQSTALSSDLVDT